LDYTCWENNVRPIDVLTDIQNKKYTKEVARIKNADMKYPIIIDSNYNILDGFHRYAKHIIDNKKTIILVIFDKKLMKKFIIGKRNEKCNLEINDYIQLFHKRFNCAQ
jgi:disulfide oxidoreductase YuzD